MLDRYLYFPLPASPTSAPPDLFNNRTKKKKNTFLTIFAHVVKLRPRHQLKCLAATLTIALQIDVIKANFFSPSKSGIKQDYHSTALRARARASPHCVLRALSLSVAGLNIEPPHCDV